MSVTASKQLSKGQQKDIQEAISKYEEFVTNTLKPDLEQTLEQRDIVYTRMTEYLKLKTHVDAIKTQDLQELETKVDLGSSFYVKAFVPDTKYLFVNVGFGFHLEMTLDEANTFIDEKVQSLEKLADKYTQQASEIRARIQLVYNALMEGVNSE
ncbi:hypothetical protein H4R99_006972 [Coemansia sp. RSA 1722]|nr:hypothetical protein LPJ57_002948 [Coemansia sp. RSA 486]KAJ2235501.1 hypothetical protein IWW45_002552 [Coemansia sp. RSA 485]KAJ2590821.1 hypothetical protein H4R99_006972 [Coemansia sp. RSA 1722]KAJ2635496.1 hypothetical protein GGF40_003572 [Coemansia sp. RSA 1286]